MRKILSVALDVEEFERLSSFAASHRSSVSHIVREAIEGYYARYETLEQAQERLRKAEARLSDLRARQASGELVSKTAMAKDFQGRYSRTQSIVQTIPDSLSLEDNTAVVALITEVTRALGSSAEAVIRGLL
jgi:predicted transcriptional regulator